VLKDSRRFCDCCDEEIPKGTKYRHARVSPEQAHVLEAAASTDSDLKFAYTEHADGSRSMDICLECTLSMGSIPTREEVN
jgi:hypothetical protein